MMKPPQLASDVERRLSRPQTNILASDLDGTLIPLPDNKQNRSDLERLATELKQRQIPLIFVTGRHLESVLAVAAEQQLPTPDWIICDVGSAIFTLQADRFRRSDEYANHLRGILGEHTVESMHGRLSSLAGLMTGLTQQEEEKQTEFKLSYYAPTSRRIDCTRQIEQLLRDEDLPFSVISSVDPFEQRGLIDLLPRGVSKAYALSWWCEHVEVSREQIIYAGDSGNDSAAFAAGYRAIIVSNAVEEVVAEAEACHRQRGWEELLYAATQPATSGVVEGLLHFVQGASA